MGNMMNVLAVVPTAHAPRVSSALAFESVDFRVFTSSEQAAPSARAERPDLIIGPGAFLSWVQSEPSLKGVHFVALDETGILSEDVALHAGAVELISLYEIPRDYHVSDWWDATIHRLVTQYKPSRVRCLTPEDRADHAAFAGSNGPSAIHVVVRNALVPVFREIDALRERIEKLEMART